jgi:hypothetical protein
MLIPSEGVITIYFTDTSKMDGLAVLMVILEGLTKHVIIRPFV